MQDIDGVRARMYLRHWTTSRKRRERVGRRKEAERDREAGRQGRKEEGREEEGEEGILLENCEVA